VLGQGKAKYRRATGAMCPEDEPRAPKSSLLVVLSFSNNHLASVRSGLLQLLGFQVIRFDPTVLDEHDLQDCKWPFRIHPVLIAVAGEELPTRFDGASCFYHHLPMHVFEAAVYLLLCTSPSYSYFYTIFTQCESAESSVSPSGNELAYYWVDAFDSEEWRVGVTNLFGAGR
jgi:hypothetical protein